MKVYSRSLGKVIDVDENTIKTGMGATSSTGTMRSPGTMPARTTPTMQTGGTTSTGGTDLSGLQQLLGLYALSKGNPTGAWTILSETTGGATPAETSRAKSGILAGERVRGYDTKTLEKTGTSKAWVLYAKLNAPIKIFQSAIKKDEKDLASLDSDYFKLTQAYLTAVQGSRPSDYDARMYQNRAGPSIMLPHYVNEQRVETMIDDMMSRAGITTSTTTKKPSLESFITE